jgi:hypothetical protein
MRAEQLEELEAHIREGGSKVALDSEEVSLVDVDVVPFLGACKVGVGPSPLIVGIASHLRTRVFRGQVRDAYEQEHIDLIESIRSGKPLNEAKQVAENTLTAIAGRESAYSGQEITWEAALSPAE